MAFMLCMAGLVMTDTAFSAGGQQCVDNKDGTVTDNHSGLMWSKVHAGPMYWDQAKSYASGLSLGDHSDWRLPTKDELLGLFNSPCKNNMVVPKTLYWSSTPNTMVTGISVKGQIYCVSFSSGDVITRHKVQEEQKVRAVRTAQ